MSDIEEHRKKIEAITLEMIKLLETRTDIAKQIGDAKASLGMTVTDEEERMRYETKLPNYAKKSTWINLRHQNFSIYCLTNL